MEHKQFTSNDLNLSPRLNQGFQPDRFTKKMNQLNIPDTIIENCSGEISGDSLKMEAPKVMTEIFNSDDKENISMNQQVVSNESFNNSPSNTIDISYIRQCERKLLDSSNSDDEKHNESDNKGVVNSHLFKVSRQLNDTISTPPSMLRKEISQLRSEMAEAHEFHDIEIEMLKEQKFLHEADPENYLELFEKYSALMELYTTLKTEYEQYRKAQEKISHELQSQTTDCLESLCSQIEASDNSLNFSTASFVSFNGGIRSSTMMEDMSEVEATVLHDATVLANDPLSITTDGVFKTPMQTPLKKELFPQEMNLTVSKTTVKEVKDIMGKFNNTATLDPEYNIQLLNLETALYDKVKEVKDLEQRLYKMEDMSSVLQNEFERISSVYARENNTLKESLAVKTDQLNELTQKLFTETISLNPSLRDSLIDVPGKKLLLVFMETIMENCKKIKGEDAMTTIENLRSQLALQETGLEDLKKTCENLERKLSDAEDTILTRDEEIRMLQSHALSFRQTREDLASTKEALSELESRLTMEEAEKKAAENRCLELEDIIKNLNSKIETNETLLTELQTKISSAEDSKQVQEDLASAKQALSDLESRLTLEEAERKTAESRCLELEEVIKNLNCDIETNEKLRMELQTKLSSAEEDFKKTQEDLALAKEALSDLESRLTLEEAEKKAVENRCLELEEVIKTLNSEIETNEKLRTELQNKLSSVEEEKSEMNNENTRLKELYDELQSQMAETEKVLKSNESEMATIKESLATADETINQLKSQMKVTEEDFRQTQDDLASTKEALCNLESRLTLQEAEKKAAENRCLELEEIIKNSSSDIETNEKLRTELHTKLSSTEEDLASTKKALSDLDSRLTLEEAEKKAVENRCLELEEIIKNLNSDIETSEKLKTELQTKLSSAEEEKSEMNNENSRLKELYDELQSQMAETENVLKTHESEMFTIKENLATADERINQLQSQLNVIEGEKSELENQVRELQNANQNLQNQITAANMSDLTEKLANVEKNNKHLMEVISEVQVHLDIPEDILSKILSGNLENKKMFSEKINHLIKTEMEGLKTENDTLKENLIVKTDQLNELTQKLFSETISLNPSLRDSLMDVPGKKLLIVFMETIMENCKKIKDEDAMTTIENLRNQLSLHETNLEELKKMCEGLEKKLSDAEENISNRDEEIRMLQSDASNFKQTQEDLASAKESFSELESRLTLKEEEKKAAENKCLELENIIKNLNGGIETNEKLQSELQTKLTSAEEEKSEMKNEISRLKELYDQLQSQMAETEKVLKSNESEMAAIKENLATTDETIKELKSQLKVVEEEKSELENQCRELQNANININSDIEANEKLQTELQAKLSSAEEEKSEMKNEYFHLKELYDELQSQMAETEKVLKTNESEIVTIKESLATAEETITELKSQLKVIEGEKSELENQCRELQNTNKNLNTDIEANEKLQTELQAKLSSAEENLKQSQEDLASTKQALSDVESRLSVEETEKKTAENRCLELEEIIKNLNIDIETNENIRTELQTKLSTAEEEITEMKNENSRLKELYDELQSQMAETDNMLKLKESEMTAMKENLEAADERLNQLKSLLKVMEEEKSELENQVKELQNANQNLENQITTVRCESNLENIQSQNDLKQKIFESEKMMEELKAELDVAKENQMNNICKVEELIREIEELKKENNGFSSALSTIEETQKNLADVLSDPANDSDLPSERINKLIEKTLKLSGEGDTRETRILSDFVDTIKKTCKGVQNELTKKFDNKKLEWETQKDVDTQNLQDQIKQLNEKNVEHEAALKRTKHELTEADERIVKLKSQLTTTEVEKVEIELRCRKLEENTLSLQAEIDTKETVLRGLDELKIVRQKIENENGDLKQRVRESEEVIIRLKKSLEVVKEEQIARDIRIKDSQVEIDMLKKEKEALVDMTEKLADVEKNNRHLIDVISEVQTHLGIPQDTLSKILSGNLDNKKMFSEKINHLIKTEMEGLKTENKHLKLGNDNLKEKVKQLTKLIGETAGDDGKDEMPNLNVSNSYSLRNKPTGRRSDLCARRLDKLEEINHNLTELITRVLTITEFPDPDKLKLFSVRDFPNVMKKVVAHLNAFVEKLKEENAQLDEECETYANIIKDLKKEAAAVWKTNKEKTETMEAEINRLKEEKNGLENEKRDLMGKISKLDAECQKLKSSKTEGTPHNCTCGNDSKKINELKRTILIKEEKLLKLQDLEAQTSSFKLQIEYLKNALEREKKKIWEEKEKNKKLQDELYDATKKQKNEEKKSEDNKMLDELRRKGTLSGGIVQEFADSEKMRKLAKDIGILKELCRARYAEIKRLEAVNAALRNATPKNSNQMDSPIRTRGYNTRSKIQARDLWKSEINGKENSPM